MRILQRKKGAGGRHGANKDSRPLCPFVRPNVDELYPGPSIPITLRVK